MIVAAIIPIHVVYEVPVTSISYTAREWTLIEET